MRKSKKKREVTPLSPDTPEGKRYLRAVLKSTTEQFQREPLLLSKKKATACAKEIVNFMKRTHGKGVSAEYL